MILRNPPQGKKRRPGPVRTSSRTQIWRLSRWNKPNCQQSRLKTGATKHPHKSVREADIRPKRKLLRSNRSNVLVIVAPSFNILTHPFSMLINGLIIVAPPAGVKRKIKYISFRFPLQFDSGRRGQAAQSICIRNRPSNLGGGARTTRRWS